MKRLMVLGLSLSLVFAFATVGVAKIRPGENVPSVTILDMEGKKVDIQSLVGTPEKPVAKDTLLVFFNSVCAICVNELTDLEERIRQSNKVNVIGVGIDMQGIPAVMGIRDRLQLTYPVYSDAEFKLGLVLGFGFTPSSAVIEKNGKLLKKHFGYDETVKKAVHDLF